MISISPSSFVSKDNALWLHPQQLSPSDIRDTVDRYMIEKIVAVELVA